MYINKLSTVQQSIKILCSNHHIPLQEQCQLIICRLAVAWELLAFGTEFLALHSLSSLLKKALHLAEQFSLPHNSEQVKNPLKPQSD